MKYEMKKTPFRHVVIECKEFAEWIANDPLPIPSEEWPHWEARYENDIERHKRTTRLIDSLPIQFKRFFDELTHPEFCSFMRELFGIPDLVFDETLHGGGLHVTSPGGWLNCHLDYASHPHLAGMERRLSAILFMNHQEWKPEWGGAFIMCDAGGNVVERVYPSPGRIVVFENSDVSYHATESVSVYAPERVTAAVFFIAPARPGVTRKRALFMPNRSKPTM